MAVERAGQAVERAEAGSGKTGNGMAVEGQAGRQWKGRQSQAEAGSAPAASGQPSGQASGQEPERRRTELLWAAGGRTDVHTLARVRVAALFEQPTQAAVAHVADVEVGLAVDPIDHLLCRPAAHADVVNRHAEGVCKVRRPRRVRTGVHGKRSVPSGERVAVAQNAWLHLAKRLAHRAAGSRRTRQT